VPSCPGITTRAVASRHNDSLVMLRSLAQDGSVKSVAVVGVRTVLV
jgi:hypothetical protein